MRMRKFSPVTFSALKRDVNSELTLCKPDKVIDHRERV